MWDSQLLNNTNPGQVSRRQFTSIKCPFFCQLALLESGEEGNYFSPKESAGHNQPQDRCLRSGHATDRATAGLELCFVQVLG